MRTALLTALAALAAVTLLQKPLGIRLSGASALTLGGIAVVILVRRGANGRRNSDGRSGSDQRTR